MGGRNSRKIQQQYAQQQGIKSSKFLKKLLNFNNFLIT